MRFRRPSWPIVGLACLYSWIGVHIVSGWNSVGEWRADVTRAEALRVELADIRNRNAALEREAAFLASRGLSLDVLDQRARERIYAAQEGELVIPILSGD